jgi:hypothetical protein
MDRKAEIREFLSSRRAKVTPRRAGQPLGRDPDAIRTTT